MNEYTQKRFSYKKQAIRVIIAFALLRCVLAFTMALGVDESYYWTYSQYLKLNYFDHPAMVAFFIRLTTGNLLLESIEGFIRLSSVIGCAVSSWFIYKTCETIHSTRAGFFGACLYNVSFYTSITAGIFIMPDTPQMVFFTLSLWLLASLIKNEKNQMNWVLFGIAAGLCIMSKVHGVFIWFGLGLFILIKKRNWLLLPQLYIALVISLIITSPILFWNIQNDFITYKFHSDRVVINNSAFSITGFLGEAVSQLVYNNPFIVVLNILALLLFKKQKELRSSSLSIYNFIAIPLAVLLFGIALFRDTTLPHWSGPAYVALIPLTAIYIADFSKKKIVLFLFNTSIICFLLVLATWKLAIHFYPVHFGEQPIHANSNAKPSSINFNSVFDGFVKMQLMAEPHNGWEEARQKFDSLYKTQVADGNAAARSPIVCNSWSGAQIEYHFARPGIKHMIGLGKVNKLHEYTWMNANRKNEVDFTTAFLIVSSDNLQAKENFSPYYHHIDSIANISIGRPFRPDLEFDIYRLSGWKNNLPLPGYVLQQFGDSLPQ